MLLNGTQLILEQLFKLVGFDAIDDRILKHLVTARLCQPSCRRAPTDCVQLAVWRKLPPVVLSSGAASCALAVVSVKYR